MDRLDRGKRNVNTSAAMTIISTGTTISGCMPLSASITLLGRSWPLI